MKTENTSIAIAIPPGPVASGAPRADAHSTACPSATHRWKGLRPNAAGPLNTFASMVGRKLTAVLAGSIWLVGVNNGLADTQTMTAINGYNYFTCQVAGVPDNDITNLGLKSQLLGALTPTVADTLTFYDCATSAYTTLWVKTGQSSPGWHLTNFFPNGTQDLGLLVGSKPWNLGEGVIITRKPAASKILTLTGTPLTTPVLKPLTPGCLYLLGSQVLGADTFENITGHPAIDYARIEVYRYPGSVDLPGSLPGSGGYSLYYSVAGVWSPQEPPLNAAECVFLRVDAPTTTAYPSHAGACSSPTVTFVGTDFIGFNATTDTVQFIGGSLTSPIVGNPVNVLNSLQVRAEFNLATAIPGESLNVQIIKGNVFKTVLNAFRIDPLTIGRVTPNQGATGCGSKSLTFFGGSICPGATVTLSGNGPPIPSTTLPVVSSDGTTITATFDLTNAALGSWDATIVNPDNSTVTATGAFAVVALVAPQIDVQIFGTPKIGANQKRQFKVAYRNIGNCASATGVTIELTGIPASVALTDFAGATSIPGGFSFNVPSLAPSDNYAYFSFYLQPTTSGSPPPFPYDVTLTANSLSPYVDTATITIPAVASYDPNDKFGLWAVGAGHYITGTETFPYEIHFENKPDASAPAQQVFVTDQLDTSTLDLSTFSLGPITFGTQTISPPPGLHNFTTDVLFDVDGNSATGDDVIIVRIVANLETNLLSPNYGRFTCNYFSYDPLTGAIPEDPDHGFLPPNVTQPDGEGSVQFTIQPKAGLADGAVIANGATIVFDKNESIFTPVWSNTLDLAKPISAVATLSAVSPSSHFSVAWSGTDAGAGIATYDIWVSDNGGAATPWLTAVATTSDLFSGTPGHTYQFHSIAHDAMGYVEDPPATPDATIIVDLNVPYDVWAGLFPTFNLIDPGADLDDDRMTNWQEYAFGLDPTSGTSVSPIAVTPTQPISTFTYTRRDPALTGLTYTVQTSTDLQAWMDDNVATAGQSVSATAGGVQTMIATISASAVDGKLFLRVKAD